MKNLFLSIFLFSFGQAKAQCVKLYVKEHLSGSRICKLMQGDYIEICEDDKEVNGCPYNFYIYDKGFASGSLTYELSLDRGWSTHYMSLFVNPSTKRFGFIQQGQTAIYSYNTEAEMTAIRARQKEQENIANQKLVEQAKIEDKQTKISINNALDGKEYFKALQLFSNLYFKDNELLNKINVGWLPEKERLDKIYRTYTEQFIQLKKEYHSASITDFLLKYQNNIKTKEITINGKEAYLKRIASTIDPSVKIYREKALSDNAYLYSKHNNKHLIAPVGIEGNYYKGLYNNKNINSLNIAIIYDTSANTHVPRLEFKNNEQVIASQIIINTNTFQIKYFSMPFPTEINKIYQKIINDSGRKILESMYSEEILYLDYYESILYSGLIKMEYPGDGKRNDKYESLKSEFEIFRKDVEKLSKDQRRLVTTNFYNPSILYLVKKMYPNADSLVFAFGDYKESLGKLGLHIDSRDDKPSPAKGGSFVPLTKGVVELKNDKFIIYDKSGNYSEVEAKLILTESKVSLINLLVDSLFLDSTFFRYDRGAEWGYIGQYPIRFEQLELRYNEDVDYIFNENLIIQRLPVYQLSDLYFPGWTQPIYDPINNLKFNFKRSLADYEDERVEGGIFEKLAKFYDLDVGSYPSDGFARKYFNEMTKYFQYKKEMNSKEAKKSLLKANEYLESFKQIYLNSK